MMQGRGGCVRAARRFSIAPEHAVKILKRVSLRKMTRIIRSKSLKIIFDLAEPRAVFPADLERSKPLFEPSSRVRDAAMIEVPDPQFHLRPQPISLNEPDRGQRQARRKVAGALLGPDGTSGLRRGSSCAV
jgi:hypothetical protein